MTLKAFSRLFVLAVMGMAPIAPVSADQTGMAGMHSWRKEGGRTCFSDHFHNGESSGVRSRKQAEIVAIQSWIAYTDFEYGSDWAKWNRSVSKRMNCTLSSSGWGCSIESRPCR